jgi:hypothetical protein
MIKKTGRKKIFESSKTLIIHTFLELTIIKNKLT